MAETGRGEVKEAVPTPEGRAVYSEGEIETEFPEVISDRAGSYESGVKTIVADPDAAAFARHKGFVMAEKLDPSELVSFKELMMANSMQVDAVAQLLITET